MPHRISAVALSALLLTAGFVPPASAEDGPISVKANMARILRISAPAATVVIGNPGVADVTIQDPQTLVLTGKSYGQTNLIVLDELGNPIADTIIEVIQAQSDTVTVFQGQIKTTVSCAPICQSMIMLGDERTYSAEAAASAGIVESSAQ
jgi:Flp pilus assembly secretin CpaC